MYILKRNHKFYGPAGRTITTGVYNDLSDEHKLLFEPFKYKSDKIGINLDLDIDEVIPVPSNNYTRPITLKSTSESISAKRIKDMYFSSTEGGWPEIAEYESPKGL